jgi:hypothetical protein
MLGQGILSRLLIVHLDDDVLGSTLVTADRWPQDELVQAVFLDPELVDQSVEGLLPRRVRLQLSSDALPVAARFAARLEVQEKGLFRVAEHPAGQNVEGPGTLLTKWV